MKQLKHIWTDSTKIILGDLLVLLSAIGATAASAEPTKFAVAIGIRPQGLKEVHNLRRLISHSVRPLLQTDDIESLNVKFSPPNSQQCKLLSELFLSGFGDQIGFLTGEEHEYKISGQDLALIHPHSVLFKRKIKIVAFQEKMENSKGHVYLKGCTEVTTDQIIRMAESYCSFIRDKTEAVKYDSKSGEVIALYKVTYTKVNEPLGIHWKKLFDDNESTLRCLTHALLDGQIYKDFKKLSDKWLSPPAVLLRPWSNLLQRTSDLIVCFSKIGIDSRAKFVDNILKEETRTAIVLALQTWLLPTHYAELDTIIYSVVKENE